jgi:hypothetical protein
VRRPQPGRLLYRLAGRTPAGAIPDCSADQRGEPRPTALSFQQVGVALGAPAVAG